MIEGKKWLQDRIQKAEQKVLKYLDEEKPATKQRQELWTLEEIYGTYLEGLKYQELKKAIDQMDDFKIFIGWNEVQIQKTGKINE